MEDIWFKNPLILYNKYWEVLPINRSINEKINNLTRLLVYIIIFCLLFTKDPSYIIIAISMLIIINIFGIIYKEEAFDIKNQVESGYITSDNDYKVGPVYNITFDDYIKVNNGENINDIMKKKEKDPEYKIISEQFTTDKLNRSFYQMPIQTIPNDQYNFANWLYKKESFKENIYNAPYLDEPYSVSKR